MNDTDMMKQLAAQYIVDALGHIAPMKKPFALGLGTGSTMRYFVDALAQTWAERLDDFICVPTSEATRQQAEGLGIRIGRLSAIGQLDMTVDGADEIDPKRNLIKGAGGALLREKIVATASKRFVVIADASKRVEILGAFPLPVEVDCFEHETTKARIIEVLDATGHSGDVRLRAGYTTDGGNYIYDLALGKIDAPEALATRLSAIAGVVEHGLFLNMATTVLVANEDGKVEGYGEEI